MFYDAELNFFTKLLTNYHMPPIIVTPGIIDYTSIDHGLRKLLGMNAVYEEIHNFLNNFIKPNTIYRIRDNFYCNYIFLLLPETETPTVMIIGPYTSTEITKHSLMQLTEKYAIPTQIFSSMEKYFYSIPYLPTESILIIALNTLGEKMWGDMKNFTTEVHEISTNHTPTSNIPIPLPNLQELADSPLVMQAIEARYDIENKLLQAVSQGLHHKAELLISSMTTQQLEKRTADPLRNLQNYCIIMNTLLRKAAENGAVHPLYIDRLSSDFARKIEAITSPENGVKLQRDMIHKYCLLVKNHSMRGYTLPIQRVITKIDSDLTADLSLNALAEYLNVNASYLSGPFKKETGTTLTEYVNKKRVEHGILLLNSTTLQIQTIAGYCGIPDVNYFTKLFKKYYHKTPKEYRNAITHGGGQ